MTIFDDYSEKLSTFGNNKRDRVINKAKHDLLTTAVASPAYKEICVNGRTQYVLMHRSDTFGEKFINCMPDEAVHIGDYVTWNERIFLVTNTYKDDEISLRATITECNRLFKWQDPDTLQIFERWGVMFRPYDSNSFGDEKLRISNREFKVYVGYDEFTSKVDLGTRFILENIGHSYKVYEIISVDVNSRVYETNGKGYIIWNIEQTQFNEETDNVELGISNYCSPYDKVSIKNNLFAKINHLGNETLKIGGSYKRFSYEFINIRNNSPEEQKNATWDIDYKDTEHIAYELDNNDIKIKILDGADVNSIVTLNLINNNSVCASLQLKVVNVI